MTAPKFTVHEMRRRRAAYAVAMMEERVRKAEKEIERIEQAIKDLQKYNRAVQGHPEAEVKLGPVVQRQASLVRTYAARRFELQQLANRAEQHLDRESKILRDLKKRLNDAGLIAEV